VQGGRTELALAIKLYFWANYSGPTAKLASEDRRQQPFFGWARKLFVPFAQKDARLGGAALARRAGRRD
jgi:hypothetical protein